MYLKNIKLSGFKSFVDATTIPVRGNMNSIVGPNGCGKSNVVDAIRWVIGETSAKQLRGQSMSDVIFNGTTSRKAVGKAAVELTFVNDQGRIVGEYAKYSEIAVRREVEREGQSSYFINGTSCRRKDILDIFLGTGLGARSYSIIEQGVVSQLIQAKPEDLRNHFEEAAGISKYRERRRETENRIKHTHENINRINDLIEELEKQLRHLKRQANAAERYKVLKEEERTLQAQVKALQWSALNETLKDHDARSGEQKNRYEECQAKLREIELELEKARVAATENTEQHNEVQKAYYGLAAEIARLEQKIKSAQEQTQQWEGEFQEAESLWQELTNNSAEQEEQIQEVVAAVEALSPQQNTVREQAEAAQARLRDAEAVMREWQEAWDAYQSEAAQTNQQAEVTRTKQEHYSQASTQLTQRLEQFRAQRSPEAVATLSTEIEPLAARVHSLDAQLHDMQEKQASLKANIQQAREAKQTGEHQLDEARDTLQEAKSRYASLEALQQAALNQHDESVKSWLDANQLSHNARLAQSLSVDAGWETAVETVLSAQLDAVCVDDIDAFIDRMSAFDQGAVTLMASQAAGSASQYTKATTLHAKLRCDFPLDSWLNGVYVAETIDEARALRSQLSADESVITRSGVWMSRQWLRVSKPSADDDGVIVREQAMKDLQEEITELERRVSHLRSDLDATKERLQQYESESETGQRRYQEASAELREAQSEYSAKQSRFERLQQEQARLATEIEQSETQLATTQSNLAEAQERFQHLSQRLEALQGRKEDLINRRDSTRESLEQARAHAQEEKQRADELGIRLASNESQLAVLKQSISHAQRQMQQLQERREQLQSYLADSDGPLQQFEVELQAQLSKRVTIESELHAAEDTVNENQQRMQTLEKQQHETQESLDRIKDVMQEMRLEQQEVAVRQKTIAEQLAETSFELKTLLEEMPEEANAQEWQERLEKMAARIVRLGPINLAAIEECQTVGERKEYLDNQLADLMEALEVLDNAIKKIDRETKSKFRDTFDRVNQKFQELFPKVFGGGRAYLELSDEDLLTAGILVKAQPPGKRNSTIHMLSGGEKALTAISLVFALFHLNPAPFCVLDEVDAPLDDANVGRFCDLVKDMSQTIQFIVISHNKVTIAAADHLMGVTMQEAGVSRMVSVDMDEALEMVEA